MHIPDGFLDAKTVITTAAVSGTILVLAFAKAKKKIGDKHIPLYGVLAAFIFAAQMLNFPVAGGTSGHFVGGALAGILLGPLGGTIVMTVVLVVQCLIFQDGGLTALGANVLNMAIVCPFIGYYLYIVFGKNKKNLLSRVFIAGTLSTVAAAIACSIELGISGTVPLKIALPAMTIVHIFIGIGEGLITFFIFSFLLKVRPDLLELDKI
ncbi:MAG: energy-coupling factor ABC transporter permease [bacterium]|nr:energy-coupling factor ABC transporter permease [bacterium]